MKLFKSHNENYSPDYQFNNNYFSTMYCIVPFNVYIFALSSTINL